MLARRIPGLGEDEAGACLPEGTPLRLELPARLTRPLPGVGRTARGQGGGGGGEEQLRRLVRYPAFRGKPAECGFRLLRRLSGQPGGQQRRTAVDGELGKGLAERIIAVRRFVEVGERLGKVAAAQCHQPAVMPGLGVLEFLPAGGEQLLGTGEVRGGTPRETEPKKNMGPKHQRPRLPYLVARPAQVGQGTTQVVVGVAEAAQVIEESWRAA